MPVDKNDEAVNMSESVRLQVYLAHSGVASRRSCERMIAEGRVSVNGCIVTRPGTKVLLSDVVCLDKIPVKLEQKKRYVLLNKPVGYVCSMSDEKGRATAWDLLSPHFSERLYNVGRLDMFSSGLVLFTNDGDFAAKISHPSSEIEKEYIVETSLPFSEDLPKKFMKGIRIDNIFYRCISAQVLGPRKIKIILVEGKNREIRRVFEFFQVGIKRLCRVRIGHITIGDLEEGKYKELTAEEVAFLLNKYGRHDYGGSY